MNHQYISQLFDALHYSTVSTIHFDKVPFTFALCLEECLDNLNLNDVTIRLVPPPEHSQYTRGAPRWHILVKAICEQVQRNTHFGVIHNDEARSIAFSNRNAGFVLEYFDTARNWHNPFSFFSESELDEIQINCSNNYRIDLLTRQLKAQAQEEEEEDNIDPDPIIIVPREEAVNAPFIGPCNLVTQEDDLSTTDDDES